MQSKRTIYQHEIDNLFNIFVAMVSLGLAFYALYIAKGNKPMTMLLSTCGFFLLALIAFVWAISILIRMRKLPKTTDDEVLKNTIKQALKEDRENREQHH